MSDKHLDRIQALITISRQNIEKELKKIKEQVDKLKNYAKSKSPELDK